MRRLLVILVSLLIITNFTCIASDRPFIISHAQSAPSAISGFWLPASPGTKIAVSQGNNQQPSHLKTEAYAFDFINTDFTNLNFVITAAQSGAVMGFSDNTTLECNEKVASSCEVSIANFVLIANDDGRTASLYLHLLPHSISSCPKPIQVGEHITQGECLGKADTTGSATGPHVHFQVEQLPSLSRQQSKPSEWWYTQSLPISFSDPEVLVQDSNGVPQTNQQFTVTDPPITSKPIATTVPMPSTQTSCPTSGTGRATVTAPYVLGSNSNIVYIFDEGTLDAPIAGILKRYDTRTGKKVDIVNLPNISIADAQVSADGQWILFVANSNGASKLQMIRMDGQGLQTLYCARPQSGSISFVQWSPNQQFVVFDGVENIGPPPVYLLNLASGALQPELVPHSLGYSPETWLSNTLVAMTGFVPNTDVPPGKIYVLDTTKGANQNENSLSLIPNTSQSTSDYVGSPDGTKLFISSDKSAYGQGFGVIQGPGSILEQSITGGAQTGIYNNSALAVTGIRMINQNSMLLLLQNYSTQGNIDTSQNGVWKMNIDGTGLTRLTVEGAKIETYFSQSTRYSWSNVSRDGSSYALKEFSNQNQAQTLSYGLVKGGNPIAFAATSPSNGSVEIAGWTTI